MSGGLKLNLNEKTAHKHEEPNDSKVDVEISLPDGSTFKLQTKKDATVEFLKSALEKEKNLSFASTVRKR